VTPVRRNTAKRQRSSRMHQTTLRFTPELWSALEDEAAKSGVSVAQYVREAALARLAYGAGRRRDAAFDSALETAVHAGSLPSPSAVEPGPAEPTN
jgi:predicted DNA-binding ribbon-helix-helix protein